MFELGMLAQNPTIKPNTARQLRDISENIKKNIFSDREPSFDYLSLPADEQKTEFAKLKSDQQTALNQLLTQRKQIYANLNSVYHPTPQDIDNGAKLATLAVSNISKTAPVAEFNHKVARSTITK